MHIEAAAEKVEGERGTREVSGVARRGGRGRGKAKVEGRRARRCKYPRDNNRRRCRKP